MDIKDLKYFIAVADNGSITKAAEQLYVTQPNLSRQLQKLEREAGKKLFERGARQITLTEAGRMLYRRACEIAELLDKTQNELLSEGDDVRGTVTIGGGESYAVGLIAKAAREVTDRYPHVRFDFFSGDTDAVCEKLDKGLIDFGVLIEPSTPEKYNSVRLPLTDTWGILARKDSPIAAKDKVSTDELKGLPLIFSAHSFKKNPITERFGERLADLNVVATYNLLYNASLMVEQGIGYAVGLDRIVNVSGDSPLKFLPFEPPLETHLDVAWKKHGELSLAAKAFLSSLRSVLSEYSK